MGTKTKRTLLKGRQHAQVSRGDSSARLPQPDAAPKMRALSNPPLRRCRHAHENASGGLVLAGEDLPRRHRVELRGLGSRRHFRGPRRYGRRRGRCDGDRRSRPPDRLPEPDPPVPGLGRPGRTGFRPCPFPSAGGAQPAHSGHPSDQRRRQYGSHGRQGDARPGHPEQHPVRRRVGLLQRVAVRGGSRDERSHRGALSGDPRRRHSRRPVREQHRGRAAAAVDAGRQCLPAPPRAPRRHPRRHPERGPRARAPARSRRA